MASAMGLGSCAMPFYRSTVRRAQSLRQHESKPKAAARLAGHHMNETVNRVGAPQRGFIRRKGRNVAMQLGPKTGYF